MAISQEIIVADIWFFCMVLFNNVSYQSLKFQVESFLYFGSYGLDKNSSLELTKDKTSDAMCSRVTVLVHCTFPKCTLSVYEVYS